jgi:hypothetical protein
MIPLKNQLKGKATGVKQAIKTHFYPVEFLMRLVNLSLDQRYRIGWLVEQFGISTHSIQRRMTEVVQPALSVLQRLDDPRQRIFNAFLRNEYETAG